MNSTLKASSASYDKYASNHHVEKKYDSNITLIRQVRHREISLEQNQYYARMIVDPNGGIFDEKGLEKTCNQINISKSFPAIHLPLETYKTYLVEVKDSSKCWMVR